MTTAAQLRHNDYARAERSEAAILGAAIGDALGWPHEMRPRRKGVGHSEPLEYLDWTKRGGGQYQPFEERIDAGSYSDDTQLILAVARCLTNGSGPWWERLALQELPFWTLYERGGGGATKRAATSWMNGNAPWQGKPDDVRRYFQAGGNGVAMRILPHCIALADSESFDPVARNILADGVSTHGHPRALVGALAYGFAIWTALRHRGTLGYGQLLSTTLGAVAAWSLLHSLDEFWRDWSTSAGLTDYRRLWDEAVHEQEKLLTIATQAIDAGAASFDEECLEKLGCFDKRVNGSGTVTAAGALYLASRHAADPTEGLRVSALAQGADTDTLASMTAGLLGAALGGAWLDGYVHKIQDQNLLVRTARSLIDRETSSHNDIKPVTKNVVAAFRRLIAEPSTGSVPLPIGPVAQIRPWDGLRSKGRTSRAHAFVAHADNGQTFFFKSFTRETKPAPDMFDAPLKEADTTVALRLAVTDLAISRRFYEEGLGLRVSRERDRSIWFGRTLAIAAADANQVAPGSILLYIEVSNLGARLDRLVQGGATIVGEITTRADRRQFRCIDPSGYQLEVFEKIT